LGEASDSLSFDSDPGRWGHSLTNLAELVTSALDAARARSVGEVGAWAGDLTSVLLDWAQDGERRVVAVDPTPHERLLDLATRRPELELVREPSHQALAHVQLPEALIIDGDHNYFTVSADLRLVAERVDGSRELPLLMLHDVGWPHGRRDAYYDPDTIPEEHRHSVVGLPMLLPGEPEPVGAGLLLYRTARREGGPGNGVLTAVEDFLAERPDLRFAIVPVFFGLGVIWHPDRPGASALAELLAPWDRNPILERVEANRVHHLATSSAQRVERDRVQELHDEERRRSAEQRRAIEALLDSSGLRLMDRAFALRHPRRGWSWAGRLQTALDGEPGRRPAVPGARPALTWLDAGRCRVGDTVFKTSGLPIEGGGGTQLRVGKARPMIERYVELFADLRPRNFIELGIFTGGSTALLFELARPRRMVAIELDEVGPGTRSASLHEWISRKGYSDRIRVHGGVDQADRDRLGALIGEEFGDEPLDLVIDDCSHLYGPTRASFNELFPRLRPGGVYIIEDWHWAHTELGREPLEGFWPDETPLTRLVFELVLAEPAVPGLIAELTIETGSARIVRGDAAIDPGGFEISECSNPRGRRLLGADSSAT